MIKYKLGDIVDVVSEREDNPSNCKYDRFVGLEHYISGEVEIKNHGSTDSLKSAMKIFKAGDILVARRNVYLRRASIVNFDGLTSGDSIVLRAKDESIKTLLPFVLNTDNFWGFAEKFADGTMSKRLSPKILLEYEFCLPDLKEQKRLADILWAANNTRKAYKKLLSLTDELVKAQFIEMFGDPVTNPIGWETSTMETVAPETQYKGEFDSNVWLLNLDMIEPNTGVIIDKVMMPLDEIGGSVCTFDKDFVLYSKLRPYLNKVVLPDSQGFATSELIPLKPNSNLLNRVFLANLLRSDQFVDYATKLSGGSRMPRVPMKIFRSFPCILPPMELQEQFVEFVNQTDKSKSELKQTILSIENVIKSLMKQNIG